MEMEAENKNWSALSYEEKNHQLFLKQKDLLDGFLERGAISKAQHDKSLHDLIEKMGDRKSTRLNSSHNPSSRMPSSA